MEIPSLTKWLLIAGGSLILLGGIVWLFQFIPIPFGKLPGDIKAGKGNFFLFAPITSSILISIIFTILINLFIWLFRK